MNRADAKISAALKKIAALRAPGSSGKRWSEADLARFEARVGFQLPRSYRRLLSEVGEQVPSFVFTPSKRGLGQLRAKELAALKRPFRLVGPVEGTRARNLGRLGSNTFDGCLFLGTRSDGLSVWLSLNVKTVSRHSFAGQVWVDGSGIGEGRIDTETPDEVVLLELRWLQQRARKAADPKRLEEGALREYDEAIDALLRRGRAGDAMKKCDEAMTAFPQHFERWLKDIVQAQEQATRRTKSALPVVLKWLHPRLRRIETVLLANRFYGMRYQRSELLTNLVKVLNRGQLHERTVSLSELVWAKRKLFGELPWAEFTEAATALGDVELASTLATRQKRSA